MNRRLVAPLLGLAAVAACSDASSPSGPVPAESIAWVTVGDLRNAVDTDPSGLGSVATSFRIMTYEFTNQQYADVLNAVAKTDRYALYNASMGTDARGGITRSGVDGSYVYAVKPNMGDKPVNYVSWFDAARVANWYTNGATSTSGTETGAYTLGGATSGTAPSGAAPAVNAGATYHLPTADQWYKAAYYKGGSINAGYWDYATQSNTAPTPVTAGATGKGAAGGAGNYATWNATASWNLQAGNLTTVGTSGGPSAYGAFDMSGNVSEWNDQNGTAGAQRGVRGGCWAHGASPLSAADGYVDVPSTENSFRGFRLASAVPAPR